MKNPTVCPHCDPDKKAVPFGNWFAENNCEPCSECGGRGNTPPKPPTTPFIGQLPQVWPLLKSTTL